MIKFVSVAGEDVQKVRLSAWPETGPTGPNPSSIKLQGFNDKVNFIGSVRHLQSRTRGILRL